MAHSTTPRNTLLALAAVMAWSGMHNVAVAAPIVTALNTTTNIATTLESALLGSNSGIAIVAGSSTYQGTNTASIKQSGTYTGFTLAPKTGSTATLSMADGIFLTTGSAVIASSNTANDTSTTTGSGANALLSTLNASVGGTTATFDSNVLSFRFNVGAGISTVSAQFVFGTEEFPTQTVTDIFGFFVDGVNYAKFGNGQLISNAVGGQTNFISNPVNAGLYNIQYNGLTPVFTVTGLLGAGNADGSHTLTIGIADTYDSVYDSGVFVSALKAGNSTVKGISAAAVPEPGSLALVGLGLLAAGMARRHKKA